jgi:hypothetical protein
MACCKLPVSFEQLFVLAKSSADIPDRALSIEAIFARVLGSAKIDLRQKRSLDSADTVSQSRRIQKMPTDSLLLSIAVCGVFLAFAIVVAVIDHRTTSWQRSRPTEKQTATTGPTRKKAA